MKFVSIDIPFVKKTYFDAIRRLTGITHVEIPKEDPQSPQDIIERVRGAEFLTSDLFVQINRQVIDAAPHLKAIFCQSVGFDNIDIAYAKSKGVKVYNCAGFNSNAVAEFVFGLITSLLRKIPAAQSHVRAGGWMYRLFEGRELCGKTLGIIGSGNVAQKIVRIAQGYSMNVIAHTKHPHANKAKSMGITAFTSLQNVVTKADIVVVSVPLTAETRHLIGKKELCLMKKDAIIVNVARQTVVDEHALAEILVEGKIAGAVLDLMISEPFNVKQQPLIIQEMINLPNVIVTPHIGGVSHESSKRLGEVFVENVRGFLQNSIKNCVNC